MKAAMATSEKQRPLDAEVSTTKPNATTQQRKHKRDQTHQPTHYGPSGGARLADPARYVGAQVAVSG